MTSRQRKCFTDHVKNGPDHIILATLIRAETDTQVLGVFSDLDLAVAWIAKYGAPNDDYRFNLSIIDVPEYGHLERTDLQ